MKLDPITLEIMSMKLSAAASEMAYFLKRTGRTLYIKESEDFSTAIADLSGKFVAYPQNVGVSGFFDLDCGPAIQAVGHLDPGDVILTNHPYMSKGLATHLPDLTVIRPFFHGGKIVSYGWAFAHSADVGGRVPSSISPSNSDIFQEGLMIPPVKLVRKGEIDPVVEGFLRANCRTPEPNMGDVRAMLAAMSLGEKRVQRIIEQHGLETFENSLGDVIEYTALRSREIFRKIPDGVYEFNDFLDDDLVSPIPIRIRVKMTVSDGLIDLDFNGTDVQVAAAYNIPTAGIRHAQLTSWLTSFVLTHDKTVPQNAGMLNPVTIHTPKGTVLHPIFPAPVGVRHAVVHRVMDAENGALAQALPEFMPAACAGLIIPTVLAEPEDANGDRNVVVVQPMVGGGGAWNGHDGPDGRHSGPVSIGNNPIEVTETGAAVTILRYGLRPDSGGPGKWRGGTGMELTFRAKRLGSQVLGRGMDRFRFQPWGLLGGKPGSQAKTILNMGREDERDLGKIDVVDLGPNDTITVLTPGGGGYGNPFERDVEAVLWDVRRGLVTAETARRDYGVVITGGVVDRSATEALRSAQPKPDAGEMFDFGPQRQIWEAVFDDKLMQRIVAVVLAQPSGGRKAFRNRLLAPLLKALDRYRPLVAEELAELGREVTRNLEAAEAAARAGSEHQAAA